MVKKNGNSNDTRKVVIGVVAIVVLVIAVFGAWKLLQDKSLVGQAAGDGMADDKDGDGIPDKDDGDMDGDGKSNGKDNDDDGDGIKDVDDEHPQGPDSYCKGSTCGFYGDGSK